MAENSNHGGMWLQLHHHQPYPHTPDRVNSTKTTPERHRLYLMRHIFWTLVCDEENSPLHTYTVTTHSNQLADWSQGGAQFMCKGAIVYEQVAGVTKLLGCARHLAGKWHTHIQKHCPTPSAAGLARRRVWKAQLWERDHKQTSWAAFKVTGKLCVSAGIERRYRPERKKKNWYLELHI
jgi:hypothetical protein